MRTICLCAAAALAAYPAVAAADRPWRGGAGAGGYLALTGPETTGVTASAELLPGGHLDRWGGRMEARSLDDPQDGIDAGLVMGGVTYEAGASRPRLAMALHAEAGARLPDPRPALGAGIRTTLWIIGPIALAADSTATFVLDGVDDSELLLASSLTLGLAR
ncbi:MAG TPA: hypothetical protein VMZ28_28340 [Kofleriaceae bacterium]|nr:hypothetical protein [Kofleriaceae bacterium]